MLPFVLSVPLMASLAAAQIFPNSTLASISSTSTAAVTLLPEANAAVTSGVSESAGEEVTTEVVTVVESNSTSTMTLTKTHCPACTETSSPDVSYTTYTTIYTTSGVVVTKTVTEECVTPTPTYTTYTTVYTTSGIVVTETIIEECSTESVVPTPAPVSSFDPSVSLTTYATVYTTDGVVTTITVTEECSTEAGPTETPAPALEPTPRPLPFLWFLPP